MSQIKAIFYLPIEDNDGRDLEVEIGDVEDEVYARFDGISSLGYVTGAYRMADASKALDTNVAFAVVLDESEIGDLERILLEFKGRTLQETLYLEIQRNVDVRFI